LVVWATRAYLVGLMGHALLEVVARAWYARQNARLPMAAAALGAVLFVGLSALLFRPLGAAGIGLSNSLAFTAEAVLLLAVLGRRYPALFRQGRALTRSALGAALGGLMAFAMLQVIPGPAFLAGAGSIAAGGLVVLPFIWPEVRELVRL
jgi:putative peptidoglycan lipid II flippase